MYVFQNGETAMHVAARCGHLHMITALLEDGANPTAFSKVTTCSDTLYLPRLKWATILEHVAE